MESVASHAHPAIPLPISACFIAKNEADRLGRAIAAALQIAAEVVVVIDPATDTDNTAAVAVAAGARVVHRAWDGFGQQKRFAEQNAKHDWILSLDADEVVSTELVEGIRALFPAPPCNFYRLRVVEVYPSSTQPRLWAEAANIVRFFNRTAGMTAAHAVHDRVEIPSGSTIGQLQGPVLHYSIRSLQHLREKYDSYTTLQAATLKKKSRWMLAVRLITEWPMALIKYYVGHCHFTGGWMGLRVALIKSHARWIRIWKMWRTG
jgi:hypothetical protein